MEEEVFWSTLKIGGGIFKLILGKQVMEMQLTEVFTSTFLTQMSSKLGDFDQYTNYKKCAIKWPLGPELKM